MEAKQTRKKTPRKRRLDHVPESIAKDVATSEAVQPEEGSRKRKRSRVKPARRAAGGLDEPERPEGGDEGGLLEGKASERRVELDDDCMLLILDKLVEAVSSSPSSEEGMSLVVAAVRALLCVRSVDRRWGSVVMGAQSLWRSLFGRLYGTDFSSSSSSSPSEDTLEDEDEDEEEDEEEEDEEKRKARVRYEVSDCWFTRFVQSCRMMPRVESLKDVKKEDEWYREENGEEDDEEDEDEEDHYDLESEWRTENVDFAAVHYPHRRADEVDYRAHQLAVILAILEKEGYEYSVSDHISIGYRDIHHVIPLARFCHAFLLGKERQLVDELGLNREQLPRLKDGKLRRVALCPLLSAPEDKKEIIKNKRRTKSRAKGFEPFVYFLSSMRGSSLSAERLPRSFLKANRKLLGSSRKLGSIFQFKTKEEGGWAPGFFNASFAWFLHAAITTIHNPKTGCIVVVMVRDKEIVM